MIKMIDAHDKRAGFKGLVGLGRNVITFRVVCRRRPGGGDPAFVG
jgi:hypothetical protein